MSNTLPQPPPVQTAVLNRLAHVLGLEVGRPFEVGQGAGDLENPVIRPSGQCQPRDRRAQQRVGAVRHADRKSTRLNSSHVSISYAVFCLKKKIHPTLTLVSEIPHSRAQTSRHQRTTLLSHVSCQSR